MSKKLIIITAAAGLLSFGGSFLVAWLSGGRLAAGAEEAAEVAGSQTEGAETAVTGASDGMASAVGLGVAWTGQRANSMTEKQLKDLVYQVRSTIQDYERRLEGLEQRELRLGTVQAGLNKDIEKLEQMRVELAAMVERLRDERERLMKTRLEIDLTEKQNLITIAAAYDRMDSSSASKILTSMCAGADADAKSRVFGGKGSNMADAVKILHYMNERTKASCLGEMAGTEPKLAAVICERLKQIVEEK